MGIVPGTPGHVKANLKGLEGPGLFSGFSERAQVQLSAICGPELEDQWAGSSLGVLSLLPLS